MSSDAQPSLQLAVKRALQDARTARLRSPVSILALLAISTALSSPARSADYTASTEQELRDAITAANGDSDPSATITLTGNVTMASTTAYPTATKSVTINTGAFTLSGFDQTSGTAGGGSVEFTGVTVVNSGNLVGGDAFSASSTANGQGGYGLALTNGSLTNNGAITGGAGGARTTTAGGTGGIGAALAGGSHINNGTIMGGSGGVHANGARNASYGLTLSNGSLTNNGTIQAGSIAGPGTSNAGVQLTGTTTLTNNGTIRGAQGGSVQNSAVALFVLGTATITNTGTIEAGSTSLAILVGPFGVNHLTLVNAGTIRSGGGGSNAIVFSPSATATSVLELHPGSVIEGNVVASVANLNDVLRLGGTGSDSFDVSAIGAAAQYRNFSIFQKNGTSTWTLTGTTANVIPWQLQDGTISISSDENLGNAAGTLTFGGGALQNTAAFTSARTMTLNAGGGTFHTDADLTLSGVISGAGALSKDGESTLTLTGVNTYQGGTVLNGGVLSVAADTALGDAAGALTFNGGTLQNAATFTLARAVVIDAGGGTFQTDVDLTSTGTISGGGALTKTGNATLMLAGTGSNVGTLSVQSGTLALDSGASLAAATTNVSNGAILRNDGTLSGTAAGDTFALAGTFIGSVSLLDGDDQVQIVEGANYSQAAFDGGAGVDTLEFTSSGTLTLPLGLTTDFENLVKRGNSALTLAGTVDEFAERITVAEGTVNLQAANVQTNELRIEPGVTLTGVGTLSGSFYNAGTLSPGNSPGVIHVGGNYTQDANGVLVSEILRTGTDLLDVGGAATLAGTHRIHVDYGLYLDGTTHTLIQAAGGITGDFASVEINQSALMAADRQLTANAERVTFTRQPFTSIGDQQSGRGRFAAWLEEQISAGQLSPEMTDYIDSLLQQPTAQGVQALLGERGEPSATVSQNSVSLLGAGFARTVFDRFTLSDSVQCSPTQQGSNDAVSCFWANGLRQWGQVGGDSRYDWTSDGGQIGVDRSLSSSWSVGGTFGYADTNTRDLSGGHNEVRSKMGGLYASYAPGKLSLGAMAFYSGNENSTRRNVLIGSAQQQARADFDSDSYGAGIRLSYRVTDEAGPLVRPFIEAFYDHIEGARFNERDAGDGNLSAHVHGRDGLRGTLGLQLADSFEGYGRAFRPALEVGVAHQFEDARSTIDLQPFSDAPSFRTYGPALDRTAYLARASLNVSLGANASIALGYGGEIAEDYSQHEGNLSFRVAW